MTGDHLDELLPARGRTGAREDLGPVGRDVLGYLRRLDGLGASSGRCGVAVGAPRGEACRALGELLDSGLVLRFGDLWVRS